MADDATGGAAAAGGVDPLTGAPRETAADAGAAADGAAADGAGAGKVPEWAAVLPDDAPDDKTLSDRAWAANKGYATVADAVKAHREMERAFGADKVPLPKGPDDKAGWDRFYKAAGRPDAPDKYELKIPEGGDKEFAAKFAGKAFEIGASQSQAAQLTEWWNGEMAGVATAQAQAQADREVAEVRDLRSTLGGDQFDTTTELARRAIERIGLNDDQVVALRTALGPKVLISKFGDLGKAMGEDGMTGGGPKPMGLTADGAEARRQVINNDKDFQKRLNDKDPSALDEWKSINAALAAEEDRKRAA